MKMDGVSLQQPESGSSNTTPEARVELRHLRYFRAVAEELSITRAAERLHIAQPPLSQQIRQLEEDLGVLLLERGERPLRLTEAGHHLLKRANEILSAVQTAVNEVRGIDRGVTGRLTIGFAGSAMYNLLPGILNAYRDRYPEVQLVFTELLAAEIGAALEAREIDIGFSRPGIDPTGKIQQELLINEPLVVAVPERHPFAAEGALCVQRLHRQAVILYPRYPRPSLTDVIMNVLERHAIHLDILQEVNNLQTALGLVAAGAGITFVPASVGMHRRSGIRFLALDPQILFSPMTVAWDRHVQSATLHNFLDIVQQHRPAIDDTPAAAFDDETSVASR